MTTNVEQVVFSPNLYANGFITGAITNTTVVIGAGAARDSDNVMDIITTANITIDSSKNGAAGLDTGSLAASTVYAIWAIGSTMSYQPSSFMLSTSLTAPIMPYQYDSKRLIGFVNTDGSSHFVTYNMTGTANDRTVMFGPNSQVLNAGAATTLTNVSLGAHVPALTYVPVFLTVSFTPSTAADYVTIESANLFALTQISGVVAAKAQISEATTNATLVSGVPNIAYVNSAASGATTIWIRGFSYTI